MPDRVIELLEQAKAYAVCGSRSTIVSCIEEAMTGLKTPRWYTPEQLKAETGKEWPDNWAVYTRSLYITGKWGAWETGSYADTKHVLYKVQIACATEAGRPPNGWRPEKE
jgi:hypothetical protein